MKDKQYYLEIKESIKDDLDQLFEVKDLENKLGLSMKIDKSIKELFEPLIDAGEKIIFKVESEVISGMRRVTTQDIELVRKFAEDNNYPEIELNSNKKLGRGKESWDNAMTWVSLAEPYRSNFLDVVTAVEKYGKANRTR